MMYSLGANSLSWDITDAKFYMGFLNMLKILWNYWMYWYRADFLAEEVPELQIAGGWEEALGKLQPCFSWDSSAVGHYWQKANSCILYASTCNFIFSPRYKQHGYLLHTAFLFLHQKSRMKNIDCFPPPPTPQIYFNLQLIFSFFQCLAELLLHYFFLVRVSSWLEIFVMLVPQSSFPPPQSVFFVSLCQGMFSWLCFNGEKIEQLLTHLLCLCSRTQKLSPGFIN